MFKEHTLLEDLMQCLMIVGLNNPTEAPAWYVEESDSFPSLFIRDNFDDLQIVKIMDSRVHAMRILKLSTVLLMEKLLNKQVVT